MGKDFIGSKSLYDQIKQIEELQKKRSVKEIVKIVSCIAIAIISIILTCFICFVIYKNGLSAESVLAVLLAFFSIFISIFFYFKADETSNKFYDSSYGFMKDQSNLLGRIEERFGEKFENLTSKIDHLDVMKVTTEKEMDNTQDEIEKTLNEVIDKLSQENKVTKSQLEEYQKRLQLKSDEYQKLRNELNSIRHESDSFNYIRFNNIDRFYNEKNQNMIRFFNTLSDKDLNYILNCSKIQKSNKMYNLAQKFQICNENGDFYPEARKFICNLKDHE